MNHVHAASLVLALVLTCALGLEHSRQRRHNIDIIDVGDPVVRVSFDGPANSPNFDQEGEIEYRDGIAGEKGAYLENKNTTKGDCLIQRRTPQKCPYDINLCEKGRTVAVWVQTGLGQNYCGGTLFNVGGDQFALTPRPQTTLYEDRRLFLNLAMNDVISFCPLDFNQTDRWIDYWTHMAFTVGKGGGHTEPKVYINGTFYNITRNGPNTCFTAPSNRTDHYSMFVGCRKDLANKEEVAGQCGFNGVIDEFCIYDRVLTEKEIKHLSVPGNTCTKNGNGGDPRDNKGSNLHHVTIWLLLTLMGISAVL